MQLALFVIVAVFTLGGAIGVVATRNVVHAALFLLLSLLGVAGIYLVLFAEFLALVQVLIYGGAIIIVVLFAVMLTRSSEYPRITDNRQWPLAILTALGVAAVLGAAFWLAPKIDSQPQAPEFTGTGGVAVYEVGFAVRDRLSGAAGGPDWRHHHCPHAGSDAVGKRAVGNQ